VHERFPLIAQQCRQGLQTRSLFYSLVPRTLNRWRSIARRTSSGAESHVVHGRCRAPSAIDAAGKHLADVFADLGSVDRTARRRSVLAAPRSRRDASRPPCTLKEKTLSAPHQLRSRESIPMWWYFLLCIGCEMTSLCCNVPARTDGKTRLIQHALQRSNMGGSA
jgi:hypothetical protein